MALSVSWVSPSWIGREGCRKDGHLERLLSTMLCAASLDTRGPSCLQHFRLSGGKTSPVMVLGGSNGSEGRRSERPSWVPVLSMLSVCMYASASTRRH